MKFAYTINGYQPVTCTIISPVPLFYETEDSYWRRYYEE
jgi:hypothetical protein